jgi:hypothetical protein
MFAVGIVFAIFVSFGESVVINCRYRTIDLENVGLVYKCESSTEITRNLTIIEEVRGSHLNGRRIANVESFYEQGEKLTFFPTNLASVFQSSKV